MGQSSSSVHGPSPELTRHPSLRSFRILYPSKSIARSSSLPPDSPMRTPPPAPVTLIVETSISHEPTSSSSSSSSSSLEDHTSCLPDECLALIFQSLGSGDRKTCSLVCKRWFKVEGLSRHRLSLNAQSDLAPHIPSLFSRFDSVSKLALRCDRRSISLNDDALLAISLRCPKLTRLKLRGCRELTDDGVAAFAPNCKNLRKLSCGSCVFGSKGLNAVLEHCSLLEELSIKRLRGINNKNPESAEPIGLGIEAKSLKSICLKELYNGQLFCPLIVGSNSLTVLKLIRCLGDWDKVVQMMSVSNNGLVEVHLERLQISDSGLAAISKCPNLEILHIVKTPECSNMGIVSLAERCHLLRKVHIDGWRTNRIGDEGLAALGKNCANLQELVLIGLNPTTVSLEVICSNCKNLERLALCSSETIRDAEISCIAFKCTALKKFCVKSCPISDNGLESLAWGCPNLVKVKIKKCKEVTRDIIEWLKVRRESLVVNLDMDEIEVVDASASDGGGGAHEELLGGDHMNVHNDDATSSAAAEPQRGSSRQSLFRSKFGFLMGRNIASCALRRWSSTNSGTGTSNNP